MPSNELIKLAVLRPRFADIIERQLRLGEREIVIAQNGLLYYEETKWQRSFITSNLDETVTALKLFGSKFKKLRYANIIADLEWLEKFLPLEKYCPQATKTIEIAFVDLFNFNHTFDNKTTKVEMLGFVYEPIALNEFFPFMQELTTVDVREDLVQHYPRLEKWTIDLPPVRDLSSTILEFFRLNSQLRHFDGVMRNHLPYLKNMSELLPNLATFSLSLDLYRIYNIRENVHFKNVKEFSLSITGGGFRDQLKCSIDNITFDQLETFTVDTTQTNRVAVHAEVMQIILQAKSLKKLDMDLRITTAELLNLVKELPQLEELSITWQKETFQSVADLLMANSSLSRINLHGPYKEQMNDLKEFFPQIVPNQLKENGISFILKQ